MTKREIAPAAGKLGVLTPGLGAVASTFIAGVLSARQTGVAPLGSVSQMAHIRLGTREEGRNPLIKDFVPLASLDDIIFGGWDPISANALEAARTCGVLEEKDLSPIAQELESVVAMDAVFDQKWVSRLNGTRVKSAPTSGIRPWPSLPTSRPSESKTTATASSWCGAARPRRIQEPSAVHDSVASFEQGLGTTTTTSRRRRSTATPPCKATSRTPTVPRTSPPTSTACRTVEDQGVPIAGKDFKTGQTLMKTLLAPGFKARMLGSAGWFSTNILGNRDGEVLDDPENFKSKEVSKLGVLDSILQPELYPDLYGNIDHVVRINYYPPRGDNKEGWDNIDIFGWMGYPMQIKIDFLCRDSILAAPIVLDLALFMDLAMRAGESGVQEWLSFYLKAPQAAGDSPAEQDLFIQQTKLKNTLREWMGELPVTHSEAG